jgi:hypothetical protein
MTAYSASSTAVFASSTVANRPTRRHPTDATQYRRPSRVSAQGMSRFAISEVRGDAGGLVPRGEG